jgi:endoglucanase
MTYNDLHYKQQNTKWIHPDLLKTGISFLLICCSFYQSLSQGYLKADGKKIKNDREENVLLRGIGLGGWMLQEGYMLGINQEGQQYKIRQRVEELIGAKQTEEFYDAWLSNFIRKVDIDSLKSWGFNSIRLPMHYNLYTLPVDQEPVKGENTWLQKGFLLTDSLLSWCKANGMYLILDLHATPGGQGNDLNISDRDPSKPSLWEDDANKQKTIALWKKLAGRYANEPWVGAYDIINEPNWGFSDIVNDKNGLKEQSNAPLKKLLEDITVAIREADKKHLIIIEGNGWGNNYNGILPPWDSNMVLSYHKYWNKNDLASIKNMIGARDKYNVPIWLGETGENSNVWFTEAIRLLEENNIGWCWWPLKKLGSNNPLQIKSNLNYDQVVNYWNKKGQKPKESNVYSGLLELATNAKLENNIYHRDVIDAMFRQPFSATAKPFKSNKVQEKFIVHAVDYDLGRNGVAYFDNDTADYHTAGQRGVGNRGRMYRNDGVDIHKDSAHYESYYVSDIEQGEWLQYTLDVTRTGTYNITITVATDKAAGKISISSGTLVVTKNFGLPATGGSTKWQTVVIKNVKFNKGSQALRVYADEGGFNLQLIELSKTK